MIFNLKFLLISKFINFFVKIGLIKPKIKNVILMYHSIVNEKKIKNFDELSKSNFEKQCELLNFKYNNRISSLKNNFKNEGNISLTFDDGYKTIIDNVLPIILKYKIPITVFICPDLIGKDNYLTVSDLILLKNSGMVDFGVHGYKHIYYGEFKIEIFNHDLEKSLIWFNNYINIKNINFLSFPFGSYNKEIISHLSSQRKIHYAFNSTFSSFSLNDCKNFLIPRISIWNTDNLISFEQKILCQWDLIKEYIRTNEKKN